MFKSAEWIGFAFITLFSISIALKLILGALSINLAFANSLYTSAFVFITMAIELFTIKLWQRVPYWVDLIGVIILLVVTYYLINVVF